MRYALGLAVLFTLLLVWIAEAQRSQPHTAVGYLVVTTCGTLPAPAYVAGTYAVPTIDVTGKTCTSQ